MRSFKLFANRHRLAISLDIQRADDYGARRLSLRVDVVVVVADRHRVRLVGCCRCRLGQRRESTQVETVDRGQDKEGELRVAAS